MLFYLGLGTCSSNSLILGAWFWGHQNYLICGAISILDAPDKPEGLMALPFHVHDSVHNMLQHSRPGDIPCATYKLLGLKTLDALRHSRRQVVMCGTSAMSRPSSMPGQTIVSTVRQAGVAVCQCLKEHRPVFVTCPTRNTGTRWRLATCSSAVAHSLTCMHWITQTIDDQGLDQHHA